MDSFIPERMAVVLATRGGVQLGQWLPQQYRTLSWGWAGSQVSKCELVVPRGLKVYPWLHWISVWDMDSTSSEPLWRGPVVHRSYGKDFLSISARDIAVFLQKTRVPMTKRWDGQYPAVVAAEMWSAMLDQQGLDVVPEILDDPLGHPFDFAAKRDEKMLSTTMDDLAKLGLRWTVVRGTPVLGPMPRPAIAALAEEHFLDHDLELVMDGSQLCNDIVLRAADAIDRGREPLPDGIVLQGIASIDDMFGVSNVSKAIKQFLRDHSKLRETLTGSSIKLRLDAPLRLSQMIPSARLTIQIYDTTTPMALNSLQVSADDQGVAASIGIEAVNDDPPELDSKVELGSL